MTNFRIVVGVDGSAGARAALRWAIREARARGGSVHAVSAWEWAFPQLRTQDTAQQQTRMIEAMLVEEIESVPPYETTGVPVAYTATEGQPADVLVEAAHHADLLVLGSHGHSRQLHRIMGSVTEACIRDATCPVVVLPVHFSGAGQPTAVNEPVRLS